MKSEEQIWTGDRCIAPDDPENWGPEWERITRWMMTDLSSPKSKYANGHEAPAGSLSKMQAMARHGCTSPEVFAEIMRRAGVEPVMKNGKFTYWREGEVAAAMRLHSCEGCIHPTLIQAARFLGISVDELERHIRFCGLKNHGGCYDIRDLRYAVSQKTWMGQVRV